MTLWAEHQQRNLACSKTLLQLSTKIPWKPFSMFQSHGHIFTLKTLKNPILGTYNGSALGNTYSHNCMMHRETLYDAEIWQAVWSCQVLGPHIKPSAYGLRQGLVAPTLNFGTPSLSRKLRELGRAEEISSSYFLFWDPLHISESNGAKKDEIRYTSIGICVGVFE